MTKLNSILVWIGNIILKFLWNKGEERAAEQKNEREAAARDEANSKDAVEDLRKSANKPEGKTPAQIDKEAEDALDNFFNRTGGNR
jgi:hypothetical protein